MTGGKPTSRSMVSRELCAGQESVWKLTSWRHRLGIAFSRLTLDFSPRDVQMLPSEISRY